MNINRRFIHGIIHAVVVIMLDQWSKIAVLHYMDQHNHTGINLSSFLTITLVWNKGISFGLFSNNAHSVAIFTVISLTIVGFLLYQLWKIPQHIIAIHGLGLIIGGAIGNVIDRIRFGAVVDFIDAHIADYHWPAFNVADSAICLGVFLLCLDSFLKTDDITKT